jgi:hypothetical protein
MAGESIELTQFMLGLTPYVVIQAEADESAPQGFSLDVKAGGGIPGSDDLACLLLLVVESLTGVDTDLYVQQVDITRRAAGLAPLPRG